MKKKRNKKIRNKLIICVVVSVLISVVYLLLVLYYTQPVTDSNTVKVTTVIDKAILDKRFNSKMSEPRRIIVLDKGKKYFLDLEFERNYSNKQVRELCNNLNNTDKEIVLTIWTHYSKDLFDENFFLEKEVEQIVDIRDGSEIHYKLESFNKRQKIKRICGIIASVMVWFAFSILLALLVLKKNL